MAEPIPSGPIAELDEPAEGREDDEDEEEEVLAPPENRLLAPRNPVAAVVDAEPDPVLCTVGVVEASPDELEEPLEDEDELAAEADELAPGLPPPAVLTTVTWRTVALPPVMVTLMPPRLPRR